MRASIARAVRAVVQPRSCSGALNPNPGSEGTTTENARAGSPPCAAGSVSGPIMSRKSRTEPG